MEAPKTDGRSPARWRWIVTDLLLLGALWSAAVFFSNPRGDFPLNDDWSYGLAVQRLLRDRQFQPTGWTAMTLVSQVAWGALFCLPAGFSFTALRFSTLVLAFVGIAASYLLALEMRRPRRVALILALTVAFNCLYFALAHTFMTDVPFTALATLSALFLVKSLRSERVAWLCLGTGLSTAAILCRQLGLFLPAAYAVTLVLKRGSRRWLLRAILPVAIGTAALLAFNSWLAAANAIPVQYAPAAAPATAMSKVVLTAPRIAWPRLFHQVTSPSLYLGLFLLPVLVLFAPSGGAAGGRALAPRAAAWLFAAGVGTGLVLFGRGMPLMRYTAEANVLDPAGIGPLTLRDTFFLKLSHVPPLSPSFWLVVTAAGLIGGALLVRHLLAIGLKLAFRDRPAAPHGDDAAALFLLAAVAIYGLPVLVSPSSFDRYLLPLLPLTAVILASALEVSPAPHRWRMRSALALLGLYAVFAVATTRDYLEWNRVRWQALRDLTGGRGVPPSKIDGGFEFNGLELYHPGSTRDRSKSWWWVDDDEYMVALGDVPGYATVKSYPFLRWLPPGRAAILVLQRVAPKAAASTNNAP